MSAQSLVGLGQTVYGSRSGVVSINVVPKMESVGIKKLFLEAQ
jgi:hypothetical protein